MYKVSFYIGNSQTVGFKWFKTFEEATDFSIKQPMESVIEIKHYDDKTNNIQNESHDYGPY